MTTPVLKGTVTAAGAAVLGCTLDLPEHGVWNTNIELDIDKVLPADGTTLDVIFAPEARGAPVVTFKGTVLWGAKYGGRVKLWLTAGKGGLRKLLRARNYVGGPVNITLQEMVDDIIKETGEVLVAGLDLSDYSIGKWERHAGTGILALDRLTAEFGLNWRTLPDGTIFIGKLTYPVDNTKPYVTDPGDDGIDRSFVVAPDAANLSPDTTLLGRAINRVVYEVDTDIMRATCYYGTSERDDFVAAVRTAFPEIPTLPSYAATVIEQRPSGLLEVLCDDPRIGPLDNVMMLAGGPAQGYRMSQGQRVRVLFASASPKLYYAMCCEQDPAATRGIARVGDTGRGGNITAMVTVASFGVPSPVTFIYTDPNGDASLPGVDVDIKTVIDTGSPDQKLKPGI